MKRIVRFGIGKGLKTFNIKLLLPNTMSEHNFLLHDRNSTKLDSVTSGRMRNIEQESETLL